MGASSSVPMTQADVAALRARREELSNQLQSVASRRKSVADRLRTADGADRVGLEQRLRVLDQRIVQLESDIAETGQQLTSAPAGLVASTAVPSDFPGGLSSGQVTGISIVFIIFVLMPMALAFARRMWRRPVAPAHNPALDEVTRRLGGIEQAVDAIAIEVERVSEGQRFVTRLMSEAPARPALGVGEAPAEPIRVRESVGVPRGES